MNEQRLDEEEIRKQYSLNDSNNNNSSKKNQEPNEERQNLEEPNKMADVHLKKRIPGHNRAKSLKTMNLITLSKWRKKWKLQQFRQWQPWLCRPWGEDNFLCYGYPYIF